MMPTTDPAGRAGMMSEAIPHQDPFTLFEAWLADARVAELNDSNAMTLATATPDGRPSVRMVLLKGHGASCGADGGFIFYTNSHSRKGSELAANPRAALLFHWKSLRRQIRIEGSLSSVSADDADAYFASRGRDSQLGALASDQSTPLDSRATFVARYVDIEARFAGREVQRPAHWTGYLLTPDAIEFWIDRPHRLHDRRLFTRDLASNVASDLASDGSAPGQWASTLLYP